MSHLIVLGGLSLVTAWLLHRGARRRGAAAQRDLPAEVRAEVRANERSSAGRLGEMEIRLHEYGREVEARMETRLAVLDRLLREADREIVRLTRLLERRRLDPAHPSRSAEVPLTLPEAMPPDILLLPSSEPRHDARQGIEVDGGDALTASQRTMLRHLSDAGYGLAELATLIGRSIQAVEAALREERRTAA